MAKIFNIDWQKILYAKIKELEKFFKISIAIDSNIILEIEDLVFRQLSKSNSRNVAYIAGQLSFWLAKLKPCSIVSNSTNKQYSINELLALLVGLYISDSYKDDYSKISTLKLPVRILKQWLVYARYGNQTLDSTIILFELITSDS